MSIYWQSGNDISLWPLDGTPRQLITTLPEAYRWIRRNPDAGAPCQPRRGVESIEFVCAVDESGYGLFLIENFDPHVN
jgi:hypothetical protein